MQQPPGAPAPQPEVLPPGTILLNRYRILSFIGGGGFGSIYEVLDLALGHRRAIKEAFGLDPQAQHQFRLEAEFLLNVQHPNLVRGYAVFEQANKLYLVMEYVDGQTLEDIAIDYIRRTGRALPEAQVIEWILPICDAVYTLHAQPVPIIHRDIKPANIKLSKTHGPVLIDLGLAKLHIEGQNTIRAALAFTPGYAPPEQYRAAGATDRRTDIYGLGATLFYLLTGYQPTEAPARLSAQALPMPRALNTVLSPGSEAVVLKAMALDPAERYQDAHAMADDLARALAALRAHAVGASVVSGGSLATPESSGRLAVVGVNGAPVAHPGTPFVFPQIAPVATPEATYAPTDGSASAPAGVAAVGVVGANGGPLCAGCGAANPPAARYCMRCGAELASPSAVGAALKQQADQHAVGERTGQRAAHGPAHAQVRQPAPGEPGRHHHHMRNQMNDGQPLVRPYRDAVRGAPQGVGVADYAQRVPRQAGLPPRVEALVRHVESIFPGTLPAAERAYARVLALTATPEEHEAWTSILAMLAIACLALSLTAAFTRIMIVFVLPALLLGHLSLAQRHAQPPRAFRYLAFAAVIGGYAWVFIWLVALIVTSR